MKSKNRMNLKTNLILPLIAFIFFFSLTLAIRQAAEAQPANDLIVDHTCADPNKCSQICIGDDCRSLWPNFPLESYQVKCASRETGGSCQLCCQPGYRICNSSGDSCQEARCINVTASAFTRVVTRTCFRN